MDSYAAGGAVFIQEATNGCGRLVPSFQDLSKIDASSNEVLRLWWLLHGHAGGLPAYCVLSLTEHSPAYGQGENRWTWQSRLEEALIRTMSMFADQIEIGPIGGLSGLLHPQPRFTLKTEDGIPIN